MRKREEEEGEGEEEPQSFGQRETEVLELTPPRPLEKAPPRRRAKTASVRLSDVLQNVPQELVVPVLPAEPAYTDRFVQVCGHFALLDDGDSVLDVNPKVPTWRLRGMWRAVEDQPPRRAILKLSTETNLRFRAERYYHGSVLLRVRAQTPHIVTALATRCYVQRSSFQNLALRTIWHRLFGEDALQVPALVLRRAPGMLLTEVLHVHRLYWEREMQEQFDLSMAVQLAQLLVEGFAPFRFHHNALQIKSVYCQPLTQDFALGSGFPVVWFMRVGHFGNSSWMQMENPGVPASASFDPQKDWDSFWTSYKAALSETSQTPARYYPGTHPADVLARHAHTRPDLADLRRYNEDINNAD